MGSDLVESLTYSLPLFIFGNYTNTLNWTILVVAVVVMFGFGWFAERPFMRHSLVTIKNWPFGMYATVFTALGAIIATLCYHIYLAYSFKVVLDDGSETSIVGWYLVGILIPVGLLCAGYGVSSAQNIKRRSSSDVDDVEAGEGPWERVGVHPHHWAIFYSIGYFTRFTDTWSNVAAGVSLGMYMHGVAAYGHDALLLPEEN
ncbi:hypothetical protein HDU84_006012 [Entophlyctis sp. JEL0112]|nr:hypothetical protein HDU84_006012 [Entophlyctis sp. JEL0112]